MKKSQLSDKQLEDLLGHMPKIKDHRDPRDIYQNIAHRVEKKKKVPVWVIPGAALAAVFFLAFILSSGLMGTNHSADKSIESSDFDAKTSMNMEPSEKGESGEESSSEQENALMMDTAESDDQDQKAKDFRAMDANDSYENLISLYGEEVDQENTDVLTYAVPNQEAQVVVPVTVTTAKQEGKSWLDQYTDIMPELTEEEWGLTDYYPIHASWSFDEASRTLSMDVKENHPYRYGSAANIIFTDSMTMNFSGKGIEKLLLFTESNPGIDLGNYGTMNDLPISAEKPGRRAYLFLKVEGQQKPYLVPTRETHETFAAAFAKMIKGVDVPPLTPSVPAEFKISQSVKDKDNILNIQLEKGTQIDESFLPNLEAILMTASEFDYSGVKIVNANIEQLGPFNLNEVLPLPVAPNKKKID
ncbi:hypothetical protein [Mesobacillus subterraneus]|uniref:Negative regulator of sigma-X activity n=1 Tax=Mesobacillus subterraneus TaxID=285983 RepID=A0A3R9DTY9_9BACI|nr:hypothetical protein [Mesobacillus subterraneus]RSD27292.1 hypothetical protein EJA10_09400 [Mesobacillus subterraneus]